MILNMEEHKRKLLLAHIAQYIAESEALDLTMQDIAEHCGVAKGTLYNYFSSKEDLLLAVVQDAVQPLFLQLEDLFAREEMPTEEKLKEIIRVKLRLLVTTRNLMKMYAREVGHFKGPMAEPETPREIYMHEKTLWILEEYTSLMKNIFPAHQSRFLAFMFYEYLRNFMAYVIYSNQELVVEADTEQVYNLFMHGAAGITNRGKNKPEQ